VSAGNGLLMMELWVNRDAMEIVVRAAMAYRVEGASSVDGDKIDAAIEAVQKAVHDAWEDPLDVTNVQ